MSQASPILLQPDEGKKLRILRGVESLVNAGSQESGGAFTLLDSLHPSGFYLLPRGHAQKEETFYILEGEIEFYVTSQVLHLGPGAMVRAPHGIPHAFKVLSSTPGRALMVTAPIERCREALSALPVDPSNRPDITQVCERFGIGFLPPPAT